MTKYNLVLTKDFVHKQQKLSKKNILLSRKITKVLELLELNPRNTALHSHLVNAKNYGQVWSSSVTGDIRIIWNYDQQSKLIILVLTFGSHTGNDKVYK